MDPASAKRLPSTLFPEHHRPNKFQRTPSDSSSAQEVIIPLFQGLNQEKENGRTASSSLSAPKELKLRIAHLKVEVVNKRLQI